MASIKLGFVGVGGMGQCAHLRNYVLLPGCEVLALAELRSGLGQEVAARYGVSRVYPDHRAMLAAEELDGIVAPQPYRRHGVLMPELYQAGVPVFSEKPLAGAIEVGARMLDALAASCARHFVGYHKRSDAATMYARDEINRLKKTGELGAMKYVRILMPPGDWIASGFTELIAAHDPLPALEWDAPPSDMGPETREAYDAFVNYYIHQVNLMRHLLGEFYQVSYADPSGVLLVVHGESGVAGAIEMSPYMTTVDWQEQALIAFEHGYIQLELPAPLASNRPGRVTVYRDPGHGAAPEKIQPQLPWVHAMRQQAFNFVAAIRGEPTPLCEAAEALDDLKIARDYLVALRGDLSC